MALPIFFDNSYETELRAAAFKVVLYSVLYDPSVSSMFNSPAADSYILKNVLVILFNNRRKLSVAINHTYIL